MGRRFADPEMMTMREVAEACGVSRSMVQVWVEKKMLSARRLPTSPRSPFALLRADVRAFVALHRDSLPSARAV